MLKASSVLLMLVLFESSALAQSVPPATDLSARAIKSFIDGLPRDAVTDRAIRVVDVGGYKMGVYGVFRPKAQPGDAVLHETKVTEIYYLLEGGGTLVTGGTMANQRRTAGSNTVRGTGIEGGVTRHVSQGDVVIIPGRTPHWWSSLDGDLSYLIFRPDPDGGLTLK